MIFFPRAAGGAREPGAAMLLALSAIVHRRSSRCCGRSRCRASAQSRASATGRRRATRAPTDGYDPGRERRAEQRARELLRSCVNDEEWEMYRDLGFIRVWGALAGRRQGARGDRAARRTPT